MQAKRRKNSLFFLSSFLPALGYWYLESNYPIKVAIIGGISLSVLEISLEYMFTKHIHTLSIFNGFLILFLGGISLLGDEGLWFKLQPFFTGLIMGGFLLIQSLRRKGLMWEMMKSMGNTLPPEELFRSFEIRISIFLITYGCFMAFVALKLSTDQWLFFKTIGFYIIFIVYTIIEMIVIRISIKRAYQNELKRKTLDSFRLR